MKQIYSLAAQFGFNSGFYPRNENPSKFPSDILSEVARLHFKKCNKDFFYTDVLSVNESGG